MVKYKTLLILEHIHFHTHIYINYNYIKAFTLIKQQNYKIGEEKQKSQVKYFFNVKHFRSFELKIK